MKLKVYAAAIINNPKDYYCSVTQEPPKPIAEPEPDHESSEDDVPLSLYKELNRRPTGAGIYRTIYESSDDDDDSCRNLGKESLSPPKDIDVIVIDDSQPSTSGLSRNVFDGGDFLHVYVYGFDKSNFVYSYVCKVLAHDDELDELWVMFAKVVGKDAKTFRLDKTDVHSVPYEDVIKKLPAPIEVNQGDKISYKERSVDVFEK